MGYGVDFIIVPECESHKLNFLSFWCALCLWEYPWNTNPNFPDGRHYERTLFPMSVHMHRDGTYPPLNIGKGDRLLKSMVGG